MNLKLSPEALAVIEDRIASGLYDSASQVVEEALRLLGDGEEEEAWLRDAYEEGRAAPRDRDVPFDRDAILARLAEGRKQPG
jgi:putative addiction module CopG family antidote